MKPTELDSMNRLRVEAERERHQLRGALLWLLWHHQGASSITGLACRRALGIGQYDHLTDSQIEDAKAWGVDGNAVATPSEQQPVAKAEHIASAECWCEPTLEHDEGGAQVWVHREVQ